MSRSIEYNNVGAGGRRGSIPNKKYIELRDGCVLFDLVWGDQDFHLTKMNL